MEEFENIAPQGALRAISDIQETDSISSPIRE